MKARGNHASFFDARQYQELFRQGLRMTLTGRRGTDGKNGGDGSRHLLAASYSLTLSFIISCILLDKAAPAQFLFVTFSLSMIFTAISTMSELSQGFFESADLAVTEHLPVTGFTRFAARFSLLCVTVGILTLNLNLVPAIHFCFVSGEGPLAGLAFFGAAVLGSLFIAAACLMLYSVLARFLSTFQLESALMYMNIAVSLGIFGLLVNIGRFFQSETLAGIGEGALPVSFPPAWFAGIVLNLLGLPGQNANFYFIVAGVMGLALILLATAAWGTDQWLRALRAGGRRGGTKSAPGVMMRIYERFVVRPRELAAFEYTAINLGRDRGFRQKAYPILGFPILLITFTLFKEQHPLFFVFMLHLMNLYLPLVLIFLPFSDHPKAGWIFEALPVQDLRSFNAGVEKAFIYRITLPLCIINAIALSLIWDPVLGVIHSLFALIAGHFYVGPKIRLLAEYPFVREFRGSFSEHTMSGGIFLGVIVFGLIGWIQYSLVKSPGFCTGMIVVFLFLHRVRFRWIERKTGGARYEA